MNINLQVRMSVADLLNAVEKQRAEHEKQYKKAMDGWRKKLKVVAQKVVDNIDKIKKFPDALEKLSDRPSHYLDSFDEAIEMLKATKDTEVKLDAQLFNQLVRGKWPWKRSFFTSNASYVGYTGATGPTGSTGEVGHTGPTGAAASSLDDDDINDAFEEDDDEEA